MLGVTLAPATAVAVADLLTDGRPPAAVRAFDPARFTA
jgi:glycine/D-amino acid oxidase-like deaminating enzyme